MAVVLVWPAPNGLTLPPLEVGTRIPPTTFPVPKLSVFDECSQQIIGGSW